MEIVMSFDLFKDIIPSILQTKKPVITQDNEKDYPPFIVNKALSFHSDCLHYANEMNKVPHVDRLLQYQYLINSIRGYKRSFQKWHKRETIDSLQAIKEYYGYSNIKAKEALMVLSDDQIDDIIRSTNKGGMRVK
jgi:hypothetical protein